MTFNTELWNGAAPAAPEAIEIERSLRFNSSDSAFLSWDPPTGGDSDTTFTYSAWVKRVESSGEIDLFISKPGVQSDQQFNIHFNGENLRVFGRQGSSGNDILLVTDAVYRDFSAWCHVVVAIDSTQSTSSDRAKIYVNGVRVTDFSSEIYPSQNDPMEVGNTNTKSIGRRYKNSGGSEYSDAYLADIYFVDGQALSPTSFGLFDDNGIWQPIAYTGSYGTNGFHLDFADNSTAAALGDDTSGNGNDWTVNNLAVGGSVNFPGIIQPGIFSTNPTNLRNEVELWNDDPLELTNDRAASWSNFGSGNVLTMDFSSLNLSFTSSLTIWHRPNNGWKTYYTLEGGSETIVPGTTDDWNDATISGSGRLTQIRIYGGTNSGGPKFVGLELDGVQVIGLQGPGNDSLRDSPTNGDTANDTGLGGEVPGNYATLNPLDHNTGSSTFSNGNLKIATTTSIAGVYVSTVATPTTGKWYAEATMVALSQDIYSRVGLVQVGQPRNTNQLGNSAGQIAYRVEVGDIRYNLTTLATGGSAASNGDIIGIALDLDNQTLKIYKNGALQVTASNIPQYEWLFAGSDDYTPYSATHEWNFGQRPFAYQAPTGFRPLATPFLDTPTIEDPSTVMDVVLWTGNGTSQTISGLEFSPDFVWFKTRDVARLHQLYDQIRGATKVLSCDTTNAESTESQALTAFTSDGFTVGSNNGANGNNELKVGWTWDGGSSTVSNTDGSITSQVRANPSAGFSIVTYTGTGSSASVGHGLNAAPAFFVTKRRDSSSFGNWTVYHSAIGTQFLELNATGAAGTDPNRWPSAATSTVFNIGSGGNVNVSGGSFVAYCFAPIEGYSAFGSYTGNGSTDGPFVYTGFRPRWLLYKNTTTAAGWQVVDSARDLYNLTDKRLQPNSSDVEQADGVTDFLSNGFKLRGTHFRSNASGDTYIYAAFAENPFALNARAR